MQQTLNEQMDFFRIVLTDREFVVSMVATGALKSHR